ncbi:hypothetical protein HY383_04220 [Candidatus Daviesbacteria bacterium]|nr:hypothetical protein [Candidatus Daviesbacteria bacterium]
MSQAFTTDNIDSTTAAEIRKIELEKGERFTGRDIFAHRIAAFTKRDAAERQEKLKKQLEPVRMHSKQETSWARKLSNVQDSQVSRIQDRVYDASQEARRFELEKRKWDQQAQEVLKDSKWGV